MRNYRFHFIFSACIIFFFNTVLGYGQAVDHIYTNYNSVTHSNDGFWSSGLGNLSPIYPDNTHELLGFKYGSVVYSTGVSDATLTNNSVSFTPANFQAFPFEDMYPGTGTNLYFAFGSMRDGSVSTSVCPFVTPGKLPFVLNSGIQGLDLGSGVTNLPTGTTMEFEINQMSHSIVGNIIPVVLVSQIADPATSRDTVYFVDSNDNLVGDRVVVQFDGGNKYAPALGTWRIDFFTPQNGTAWEVNTTRQIRLWAKTASDFGIDESNYLDVKKIRYKAKGSSDPAFIAYNTALIQVTKAIADVSNTTENTPVTIDVLDNDSYSATANLTLTITSQGSKGVAVVNPDNTITYTPNSNASGNDTFSYQIHDDVTGANSTANVNVIIENNFWIGNLNTSWSNTANWTAGIVPAAGSNIIFATVTNYGTAAKHDLFLDHDRSVGNVIIKTATAKLRIPAGKSLTVKGIIDTDASSDRIVLEAMSNVAGASLIFPNENNPVYATVNMWSKAYIGGESTIEKYRWQYFGIPLHTLQAYPTFTGSVLREFNETETQVGKQWVLLEDASVLQAFKGYEISQPEAKMLTFQGTLVKNNYSETQIMSSGAVNPGYHLLSNPYTAAIDITKIAFGEGMDKTVYLFNTGGRNDWSSHSGTFGNSTGQYLAVPQNLAQYTGQSHIPSMQGFFVRALTASDNTVSINYATAVVKNQHALRAPSPNSEEREKVYSAISLTSDNYEDLVLLFTEPDCSNSFDNGWDGYKMNLNEVGTSLSVVQADGNYQINSTNDINGTELAFKASDIDLNYTLSFKHVNLQNAYQKLYLIDKEMGKTIDVSEDGSQYNFTSKNNVSARNRFTIITRKASDGSETKDIVLSQKNRLLIVDNKSEHDGIIGLYDLSGRLIVRQRIGANLITTLSLTEFQQGVYIVKADYGTKRKSDKIMIE